MSPGHAADRWSTAALTWACAAAAALSVLAAVRSESPIAEDAAILMRYARHLSLGLGYVWNPGDPPVDGATDWLATLLLGGVYATGIPLALGPRLLAAAAHVLTVALVVVIMRRTLRAPVSATLASVALLSAGPARAYIQAGFLTPLFAFTVLAGWSCLVSAATGGSRRWTYAFALAMLAATLVRPEGVVFAVLMTIAAFAIADAVTARRVAMAMAAIFAPVLVVFVLWRWQYFGRALPLPFLKKGAGTIHWDGLVESIRGCVVLVWWSVPLLVAGVRDESSRRWVFALAIVCGGFAAAWLLLSSEMNYLWRFQYAIVPIIASTWWVAAAPACRDLAAAVRVMSLNARRAASAAAVVVILMAVAWQYARFRPGFTEGGLRTAGELLRTLGGSERRLVTTEAGLLPLYSEWRTVDAWGLNDPRVVSDHGMTESYLSATDPDVIMFHAYYTPRTQPPAPADDWDAMVRTLHDFAVCHGYHLAAAFAPEPTQAHYYFVKPAWRDAGRFTDALHAAAYDWATRRAVDLSTWDRYRPTCRH